MPVSPESAHTEAPSQVSAATAPYPVVVVDATGQVVELNEAAETLLPSARVGEVLSSPDWLAAAHRTPAAGQVSGAVGEGFFSASSSVLPGGGTVWWLVEETRYRPAERELEAERERARFLAEASSARLASLNLQRYMEVTARLAATPYASTWTTSAHSSGACSTSPVRTNT